MNAMKTLYSISAIGCNALTNNEETLLDFEFAIELLAKLFTKLKTKQNERNNKI